jgi:hypothetical protein
MDNRKVLLHNLIRHSLKHRIVANDRLCETNPSLRCAVVTRDAIRR